MKTREKMLQARDLIKKEQYDKARKVLKNIDHPTAQSWLAKLNEIAPPKASNRGWHISFGAMVALVVVILVVGVLAIGMQSANGRVRTTHPEYDAPAHTILNAYCTATATNTDCNQWASSALQAVDSFDVVTCNATFAALTDSTRFGECLVENGIALPQS